MAQFIREHYSAKTRRVAAIRRLNDRYLMFKHRLALANVRLVYHLAKRFRHFALSYEDLVQEGVSGLMQAIDRFDLSHGTRLATYATWWIRQTLQIAVAGQSNLVNLSPFHVKELGLLQEESERLAHGGKHLPSAQELAKHAAIDLKHLTHLQIVSRTPVSLDAVIHEDTDFQLAEALADDTARAGLALWLKRLRCAQPDTDRADAAHQQRASAADSECRFGKATRLGRGCSMGGQYAFRLALGLRDTSCLTRAPDMVQNEYILGIYGAGDGEASTGNYDEPP